MPSDKHSKMRPLDPSFVAEVDSVDEATWTGYLEQFDDANIYQTWTYDEVRCGRENISHIVLKKDGVVAGLAQARIAKLPLLNAGVAYVRWAPIWKKHGEEPSLDTFRQLLRALRNEYACRRGLVLRVFPVLFHIHAERFGPVLEQEGFTRGNRSVPRTLQIDLTRSIPELRKGLRSHWLRYLKVAEKSNLEVIEGTEDHLFESFVSIYRELLDRKKFVEPNDIREFRAIQKRLPEKLKLKIMLCKSEGQLCSGLICSAIGNTGIYLYGATSNAGLKSRGSYLLHWRLIEWLKQNGVTIYDLHGINPVKNPGTYKFKSDMAGDNGSDLQFLGMFDASASWVSHSLVTWGTELKSFVRSLREKAANLRAHKPAPASPEPKEQEKAA